MKETLEEIKKHIVRFMREEVYRPLTEEDLAGAMAFSAEDLHLFWQAIEELEETAVIIKTRNERLGLPARMNLAVGRLSMSAKGFGFITPEETVGEDAGDIFVPGGDLNSAMHGDRVVARVSPAELPGRAREGVIIRVVERANTRVVGTVEIVRKNGFVIPDDKRLSQDIFVSQKALHGAKAGMKVVVHVTKWPEGRRSAEGEVVEKLGDAGAPGVDVLSVMRQYGLTDTFPKAVRQAADVTPQEVRPEDMKGRADRRKLSIVTVDGEDAKDLDDGIYAERRPDGGCFLGVYIADVSYYVRENEALDVEARERGTSVYLVDRVIPMLPTALSNGICSLNTGVDRLSMACEMVLDASGEVRSYEILPTVIHVRHRLTYTAVNAALVEKDAEMRERYKDVLPMLELLAEVREKRKAIRRARGSIDFEIAEVKVKLDEAGHPVELVKRTGSLAESVIEECMLAANETVAEHMEKKELPFICRVHEQPSEEKLERLNTLLAAFSLHVAPRADGSVEPRDIQAVLEKVKGKPEERIISAVALRSMQQARYAPASLGHFGLAARYYTHFTSPIRRYPDLIVHRLLRDTFRTGTMTKERQESLKEKLPVIAQHSSERERNAVEAERETTDMKKIEYMVQFVGEEFTGVISGVTAFGIFVELENGVEGLVHVSSMVNDYYEYREELFALVGESTGVSYRLGNEVEVVLMKADLAERKLDFVLKDNGITDIGSLQRAAREDKAKRAKKSSKSAKEKKKSAKSGKEANPSAASVKAPKGPAEGETAVKPAKKDGKKSGRRKPKDKKKRKEHHSGPPAAFSAFPSIKERPKEGERHRAQKRRNQNRIRKP
ncbi:ribonuclease R [Selenomonas sp. TAMA-11512]|uniref:ribonuclease R n=1 Tax=Selenomonas sp. TAMA-11512 TaxID=3095337 RepID=UPI00308A1D85|nr:ribonuclease R [Selenomonas sp. TAMA-11512]